MDNLFKIGFIVVNFMFLVTYIVNFIIGLVRDINVKKLLKAGKYQTVEAEVIDIKENKRNVNMLVEFIGPKNLVLFSQQFDFSIEDWKKNHYKIGQKINVMYTDPTNQKRLHTFPFVIEGAKIKLDKGPLFANGALVGVALYFSLNVLLTTLNNYSESFDKLFNPAYIFIVLIIYFVLFSYLTESLFSIPRSENQNYLKVFGHIAKARVVTFKLAGSKNARGFKESRMTIEYSNHLGETTRTNLASYLYTETQEEYIDIVYDPKNPKNVVYLKR